MDSEQAGHRRAFAGLEERAWEPVFRKLLPDLTLYARKRTAAGTSEIQDIVAGIFLEAIRSIHTYDPEKGPPNAWVFGIARRYLSRWHRDQLRRPAPLPLTIQPVQPEADDMPALLEVAIAQLPEEEREMVRLRYFERARLGSIAARFGLTDRQTSERLSSIRKRLRKRLRVLTGSPHVPE